MREALDSIVAQTYRPIEIIVADDGSTDGTRSIVMTYNHAVRYLSQPNAGTATACNLGLRAACGEFVAFLSNDDLWHREKLERQMPRLQAAAKLAACLRRLGAIDSAIRFEPHPDAALLASQADSVKHYRALAIIQKAVLTTAKERMITETGEAGWS